MATTTLTNNKYEEDMTRGAALVSTIRETAEYMEVNRELYSHCKRFCNWYEGKAKRLGLTPKAVERFTSTKNGRIKAILAKKDKSNGKIPKRGKPPSS